MKKILLFLAALCFAAGMLLASTATVSAAPVYVWDFSAYASTQWGVSSSYTDAQKNLGSADDDYCWAFAASNVLSWTGWDGGLASEDAITQKFLTDWPADASGSGGGNGKFGMEWWFTGGVDTSDPLWMPGATPNSGTGGYYTEALFNSYSNWWDGNLSDGDDWVIAAVDGGYGATLGVASYLGDDPSGNPVYAGHEITLWGYESTLDPSSGSNTLSMVYVSDSDPDGAVAGTMEAYDVYLNTTFNIWMLDTNWTIGGQTNMDVFINTVAGLLPNLDGIEPNDSGNPTVPEPGTMLLFGFGLLGLAGWGRKKQNV